MRDFFHQQYFFSESQKKSFRLQTNEHLRSNRIHLGSWGAQSPLNPRHRSLRMTLFFLQESQCEDVFWDVRHNFWNSPQGSQSILSLLSLVALWEKCWEISRIYKYELTSRHSTNTVLGFNFFWALGVFTKMKTKTGVSSFKYFPIYFPMRWNYHWRITAFSYVEKDANN